MGINIGGAFTINGVSGTQALKIAGASDALVIDTTGRTTYPNQIGFISGYSTDPGWVAQALGWTAQKYQNATTYNKGGGFSAGRFTAPVAGSYLFHWVGYENKVTAGVGVYIHPTFWVNGTYSNTFIRLKAHDKPASYSFVGEVVDIIYLNVGDYVELHIYHSAAGISLYWAYSQFSGFLVG